MCWKPIECLSLTEYFLCFFQSLGLKPELFHNFISSHYSMQSIINILSFRLKRNSHEEFYTFQAGSSKFYKKSV